MCVCVCVCVCVATSPSPGDSLIPALPPPWVKMSGVCETPEGLRTATLIIGGTVALQPQKEKMMVHEVPCHYTGLP